MAKYILGKQALLRLMLLNKYNNNKLIINGLIAISFFCFISCQHQEQVPNQILKYQKEISFSLREDSHKTGNDFFINYQNQEAFATYNNNRLLILGLLKQDTLLNLKLDPIRLSKHVTITDSCIYRLAYPKSILSYNFATEKETVRKVDDASPLWEDRYAFQCSSFMPIEVIDDQMLIPHYLSFRPSYSDYIKLMKGVDVCIDSGNRLSSYTFSFPKLMYSGNYQAEIFFRHKMNDSQLVYSFMPYNQLRIWNVKSKTFTDISAHSASHTQADTFDWSLRGDKSAINKYLTENSFFGKVFYLKETDQFLRVERIACDFYNEDGTVNAPLKVDWKLLLIDNTGKLLAEQVMDGNEYLSFNIFYFNHKVYLKNEKKSTNNNCVFDVYELDNNIM